MRVIAGTAKGHKLFAPVGLDVRPTLDRVKESVFSMLYPYLSNASVLDLFAGTGALGIEALSRGASRCTFVDLNRKSLDTVKINLEKTHLYDKSDLVLSSADKYLKTTNKFFDIVFIDPPYSKGIENDVFPLLCENVNSDSIIVLETEEIPPVFDGFSVFKQSKYGRVYITLLKKEV